MSKGKKLIIKIGMQGDVQIAAYCLTTDSWQDYLSFVDEAHEAFKKSDRRRGNRNLRAALLALFSHFEGVLNNICAQTHASKKIKNGSLSSRISYVKEEAGTCTDLPNLNFRLGKYLRDILAHPGIEKAFEAKEKMDEISVYEKLTVESLKEIGNMIDRWLSIVTNVLHIERFTDTRKMVEEFGEGLGTIEDKAEI
jgi:hypothetical protein